MKTLLITLLFLSTSIFSFADKSLFSGEWKLSDESSSLTIKENGQNYTFSGIEFDGTKHCVFKYTSAEGDVVKFRKRIVISVDEICVVTGSNFQKAALEFYSWAVKDGALVLSEDVDVQWIKPSRKGATQAEYDLALKEYEERVKLSKALTLVFKFHR